MELGINHIQTGFIGELRFKRKILPTLNHLSSDKIVNSPEAEMEAMKNTYETELLQDILFRFTLTFANILFS